MMNLLLRGFGSVDETPSEVTAFRISAIVPVPVTCDPAREATFTEAQPMAPGTWNFDNEAMSVLTFVLGNFSIGAGFTIALEIDFRNTRTGMVDQTVQFVHDANGMNIPGPGNVEFNLLADKAIVFEGDSYIVDEMRYELVNATTLQCIPATLEVGWLSATVKVGRE